MYILGWSIEGWLYKVCISLYTFAADVYSLILKLLEIEIMDNETIKTYAGNVSVLVGIFMLFRVAISLLSYLVNPDEIDDKKVGTSSLITGIVVTMAMLLTYQLAFGALRTVQHAVLNPKDGNNVLVQLFSGSGNKESGEYVNGRNCYYDNGASPSLGGDSFDANISLATNNGYKQLTYIDNYSNVANWVWEFKKIDGITIDRGSSYIYKYDEYKEASGDKRISWWNYDTVTYAAQGNYKDGSIVIVKDSGQGTLKKCPQYLFITGSVVLLTDDKSVIQTKNMRAATLKSETKKAYVNDAGRMMAGSMLFSFVECDSSVDHEACNKLAESMSINNIEGSYDYVVEDSELNNAISFNGFIALIFGIVLILFLVTTTADVAVRAVKLIILEVFAPIPIVLYCDPKTRNTFESWLKTVGTVYVDIFIRIAIISICNFLISTIYKGLPVSGITRIVLILGILLFIKEAPQFICNMLGIKAQGLGNFTLNPMDKLKQTPILGSAMGAAGAAATSGIVSAATGHKFGDVVKDTLSGGGEGWRKNGGMMSTGKEVAPGWATRTAQAVKQGKKAVAEKNAQTSRDVAMFSMADQLNKGSHTNAQYKEMSSGKGMSYKAVETPGDHTVHAHLENIEGSTHSINNTTASINTATQSINDTTAHISSSTSSMDYKMPNGNNPGRIYTNGDDVGE